MDWEAFASTPPASPGAADKPAWWNSLAWDAPVETSVHAGPHVAVADVDEIVKVSDPTHVAGKGSLDPCGVADIVAQGLQEAIDEDAMPSKKRRVGRPRDIARYLDSLSPVHEPGEPSGVSCVRASDDVHTSLMVVPAHAGHTMVPAHAGSAIVPLSEETKSVVEYKTCDGYCGPLPVSTLVCEGMSHLENAPQVVDADIAEFCQKEARNTHLQTKTLRAAAVNKDRRTLQSAERRYITVWWSLLSCVRWCIEVALMATPVIFSVVYFMEFQRYDETPLPLRIKKALDMILDKATDLCTAIVPAGMPSAKHRVCTSTSSSTKKIFQTDQSYGFILKAKRELYTFIGQYPQPLRLMESAKANVLTECLLRNIGSSRALRTLRRKCRWACGDGHPSNKRGEQNLKRTRPTWPTVFLRCEVHIVALCLGYTLKDSVPDCVRGLLYTALSVQHGEFMEAFRMELFQECFETLELKIGTPSPFAVQYRMAAISLFFPVFRDGRCRARNIITQRRLDE